MNVAQRSPAQSYGCRNIRKAALHENYIRRIDGNICSCTYGNAYIRSGERRRIVYAVTNHRDFSFLLKPAYNAFFAVRKDSCDDFVYACFFSDGASSLFIVSCKHYDTYAHVFHLFYCLAAVLFDYISNGYYA